MRSIYQNFCPPWVVIIATVVAVATAVAVGDQTDQTDQVTPVGDQTDKFGIYHPDPPRPTPRPTPDARTLYATRIVLQGPDVIITLDADPKTGNPGITMTRRSSGQSIVLYLAPSRAVVGTKGRGMPNLGAAIFSTDDAGYLQIRDRRGADVMPLREIKR